MSNQRYGPNANGIEPPYASDYAREAAERWRTKLSQDFNRITCLNCGMDRYDVEKYSALRDGEQAVCCEMEETDD